VHQPMGLVVDRDAEALTRTRRYPCPAVLIPLDTTIVVLRTGPIEQRIDRASIAVMPARAPHVVEAPATATAVVVTLLLVDAVRAAAAREYAPDLDPHGLAEVVSRVRVLPRTRWIEELVHRFVFEREVCGKTASRAARFLEVELVKEVFFLGREQIAGRTRDSVLFEGDELVVRARAWIEARLFEPFRMGELVRHCHASASTVLRAFHRELGVPPLAYVRRRRLEEALQLLESGRYSVTEIATRIGYENSSAFAAAFRDQFGVAPSRVRPASDGAIRLPAHGMPPVRRRKKIAGQRRRES
jgi:AraC-like DNA-binding protein